MDPTDPRIARALATLTATTLGADWVEPSELRHRARSRRSLRRGVVVGAPAGRGLPARSCQGKT